MFLMGDWGTLGQGCHCDVHKILCKSPRVPASPTPKMDNEMRCEGVCENTPNFLKRRYAAQKFFFPRGRAKNNFARTRKNGFEPGFEPGFSPFWLHLSTDFSLCVV